MKTAALMLTLLLSSVVRIPSAMADVAPSCGCAASDPGFMAPTTGGAPFALLTAAAFGFVVLMIGRRGR